MAVPFSTTTMATALSPTSQPRPASLTKANGQQAQDGLTTTGMDTSISSSPITSSGPRRTTYGAASALLGTVPIAIPITIKGKKPSSTTTTITAPLPT